MKGLIDNVGDGKPEDNENEDLLSGNPIENVFKINLQDGLLKF